MISSLKKILSGMYSTLLLEDLFPHRIRRVVMHIFGSATLVLILVLILEPQNLHIRGGFLVCLAITLFVFTLEAFFYSTITQADQKKFLVSFEVGEILFFDENKDLTEALLFSDLGDCGMKHLGITEEKIKEFLTDREVVTHPLSISNMSEYMNASVFFETIYDNDSRFADFLLQEGGINKKDFIGVFLWMIERQKQNIIKEKFWSKERLFRIPALGTSWAFGEAYTLQKYSEEISSFGLGTKEISKEESDTLSRIVNGINRTEGGVCITSEEESSRLEVIHLFREFLDSQEDLASLRLKKITVFDPHLFIQSVQDKISFEREFQYILSEIMFAQNIIFVLPAFSSFVKSASVLGVNLIEILTPFLHSPFVNLIILDSKKEYFEFLTQNNLIKEYFELIEVKQKDDNLLIRDLLFESSEIERKHNVIVTYQAILTIVESAHRYFEESLLKTKAQEILIDALQKALHEGSIYVLKQHILDTVSSKTGIPLSLPHNEEKDTLLNLEEILHKKIIGQNEAVSVVAQALKRSRAGIADPRKPIGTFLFLGPTGVGKTETTKVLSSIMFHNEDAISRFDMGEYHDNDSLERLIGSFDSGKTGTLSIAIREKPYGILLLDEFEKTTQDVVNLFLRIFDEGVFTDALGQQINVRNNIIIATSNASSDVIWEMSKQNTPKDVLKGKVIESIIERGIFKPEILNRFDAVVVFEPLNDESLKQIALLLLEKIKLRMREKGVIMDSTPLFLDYLVKKGTDPEFGARPMKRAIVDEIEKNIAEYMIRGDMGKGSKIVFDIENAQVVIRKV